MCDGLGDMQAELGGLLSLWGKGQFPNWVWVITLITKNSIRPLIWAKYVYRVILWEILHCMILCHFSLRLQLLQIPPLCCCGEKQKERRPLKYQCRREDVGWGSADGWHFFVSCPPSALAHAHTYIFPLQLRTVTGVNGSKQCGALPLWQWVLMSLFFCTAKEQFSLSQRQLLRFSSWHTCANSA